MRRITLKSIRLLKFFVAVGLCLSSFPLAAQAAVFSSTKAEFLYGWNYERADEKQFILTLANTTTFKYGDSYFFLDVGRSDNRDDTDGIHLEWDPRLSLFNTFGNGPRDAFIQNFYIIGQTDIDGNRYNNKVTLMGGLSVDLKIPGFLFFKTHVQYRDDPTFDGQSVQFNLVWNAPFKIKGQKFGFEGFLDYTTDEGDSEHNLLTQPQLLWYATDHLAFGVEYQYWYNRLGIDGLTESTPQIMMRWTF